MFRVELMRKQNVGVVSYYRIKISEGEKSDYFSVTTQSVAVKNLLNRTILDLDGVFTIIKKTYNFTDAEGKNYLKALMVSKQELEHFASIFTDEYENLHGNSMKAI